MRSMLWRYGYLDGLFASIGYDDSVEFDYGKVRCMPKKDHVEIEDIEKYSNTLFNFMAADELATVLETIDEEEVDLATEFVEAEM